MSNEGKTSTVNRSALENVAEQRDLGVQEHGFLTVVSQMDSGEEGVWHVIVG